MRTEIDRIFREFPGASGELYAGHALATFIRSDIPRLFGQDTALGEMYKWDASPGKGKWLDAPWIACFNTLITDSARHGYYPVYLFSRIMDKVILSLCQGAREAKEEFGEGKKAKAVLELRAEIMRRKIEGELSNSRFQAEPISLSPSSSSSRIAFYESGHVFGLEYDSRNLPSEEEFLSDITEMVRLYELLIARGGFRDLDVRDAFPSLEEIDTNAFNVVERRKYRLHKVLERKRSISKKVKEVHGFTCRNCGINFEEEYGQLGKGFIEAHHKTPLSTLPLEIPTVLSPKDDFEVLCSNCHSMIHRKNAPKHFEEFLAYYESLHAKSK